MLNKLLSLLLLFFVFESLYAQKLGKGTLSLHSIVLNSSGTVYTWGYNNYGQLGNGIYATDSNIPVAVNTSGVLSGKTIVDVAAGSHHCIALASDGTLYTWGRNFSGQLGNGNNTDSNVPVAVDMSGVLSGKTITQISSGAQHCIVLASDGTVYTWGSNNNGQLGIGNITNTNVPVAVDMTGVLSGKTITKVIGLQFSCFVLTSDGKVYTWGFNTDGELGNGNNTGSLVPVAVDMSGVLSGKTITQISAGGGHCIVLASDGKLYSWGYNSNGELGNGNTTWKNVPVAVDMTGVLSGKTISQIVAGSYHNIVLTTDGNIYTWGYGLDGRLGNSASSSSNVPVAVTMSGALSGKTITQVSAGWKHCLALASDGTLYSWGNNSNGQLGNGNNTSINAPAAVDQTSMGALPVELTSFTANVIGNNVNLNWQTATEVNNYGFEVQRAVILRQAQDDDQQTHIYKWEKIGFVQGNGNSNSPKSYSFIDESINGSKFMYRLKQIDFDGTFKYSDVVEVNTDVTETFTLEQNYPNPFNPTTTIKYAIPNVTLSQSKSDINVTLKVYDVLGREVATLVNEKKAPGNYEVKFDASNLASGIYFYRINSGKFSEIKKMILVK